MATKIIYFVVDGKNEQAEFRSDDFSDDLKGKKKSYITHQMLNEQLMFSYILKIL